MMLLSFSMSTIGARSRMPYCPPAGERGGKKAVYPRWVRAPAFISVGMSAWVWSTRDHFSPFLFIIGASVHPLTYLPISRHHPNTPTTTSLPPPQVLSPRVGSRRMNSSPPRVRCTCASRSIAPTPPTCRVRLRGRTTSQATRGSRRRGCPPTRDLCSRGASWRCAWAVALGNSVGGARRTYMCTRQWGWRGRCGWGRMIAMCARGRGACTRRMRVGRVRRAWTTTMTQSGRDIGRDMDMGLRKAFGQRWSSWSVMGCRTCCLRGRPTQSTAWHGTTTSTRDACALGTA
ncbi:hypothetical protein C8J57DRAFT_522764 [Mycena rebaudengoi]|nr:hypothetical protein C8J57DRAFT_522764 [Mycena rebaudengoi]